MVVEIPVSLGPESDAGDPQTAERGDVGAAAAGPDPVGVDRGEEITPARQFFNDGGIHREDRRVGAHAETPRSEPARVGLYGQDMFHDTPDPGSVIDPPSQPV